MIKKLPHSAIIFERNQDIFPLENHLGGEIYTFGKNLL
jgi:hypothetical protein